MKNFQYMQIALLFMAFALPHAGTSQESSTNVLKYEVNRANTFISITKENLIKAKTLLDLNKNYKPLWIREFVSVEILANYKGKTRKAVSKNDNLSQEQKDIMGMADVGTDISVNIRYLPENTLKNNDVKEINFSFVVEPESGATFPGGEEQLKKYLKEKAIDNIPEGSFKNYDLAAVYFTINEEGQITNAHVFEDSYQTYKNEKIEELLLGAICNMPRWRPAAYSNGTKVKQEFVLTVGNHDSCLVPLLNIRQL